MIVDIIVGSIFVAGIVAYLGTPLLIKWKARKYAQEKLIQEKQFKPMCKLTGDNLVTVEEVQKMVDSIDKTPEPTIVVLQATKDEVTEVKVKDGVKTDTITVTTKKKPTKKYPRKGKKKPASNRRRNPDSKE